MYCHIAQAAFLLTLHSQGEARAARLPLRVRRPAGIRACTLPLQLCQVHDFRTLARHTHSLQRRAPEKWKEKRDEMSRGWQKKEKHNIYISEWNAGSLSMFRVQSAICSQQIVNCFAQKAWLKFMQSMGQDNVHKPGHIIIYSFYHLKLSHLGIVYGGGWSVFALNQLVFLLPQRC